MNQSIAGLGIDGIEAADISAGDVPYGLLIDKMRKVLKNVLMSPCEKLLELRNII